MAEPPDIHIRRLEPDDDRSDFSCGDIDLDRFFRRFAGQNQFRHHIGTTYVAEAEGRILGYATVAAGELAAEHLPASMKRRLPAYPLPVLRIARLAVDRRYQGLGIGRALLRAMLLLAVELRDQAGCIGVVVDARQPAVPFYARLGFQALEAVAGTLEERPVPVPMFLSLRQIEAALQGHQGQTE